MTIGTNPRTKTHDAAQTPRINAPAKPVESNQTQQSGHIMPGDQAEISPARRALQTAQAYAETAGGNLRTKAKLAHFRQQFHPQASFLGPIFGHLRGAQVFGKLLIEHGSGASALSHKLWTSRRRAGFQGRGVSTTNIEHIRRRNDEALGIQNKSGGSEFVCQSTRLAYGKPALDAVSKMDTSQIKAIHPSAAKAGALWHQVKVPWQADYKLFGKTIHNEVVTTFAIDAAGKIRHQRDDFDAKRWMDQALPWMPKVIRHSGFLRGVFNVGLGVMTWLKG